MTMPNAIATTYKFLATGAIGPIPRFAWPRPPRPGTPGAWLDVAGPVQPCRQGVHVCGKDQLAYWLHEELWRVEVSGPAVDGADCVVVPRARLIEPLAAWSDGGVAQQFAVVVRDCAAQLIPHAHWKNKPG